MSSLHWDHWAAFPGMDSWQAIGAVDVIGGGSQTSEWQPISRNGMAD